MTTSQEWAERLSGYVPEDRPAMPRFLDHKTMTTQELVERCKAMRQRGLRGDWTYSLSEHTAMRRELERRPDFEVPARALETRREVDG